MCRMIAFVGEGSMDLEGIFGAFREGSKCDPYVTAALGRDYDCHPDGWGYALYDGSSLRHFRSSLPVWQEKVSLPKVTGKNIYGIFHSRLASDPSLNSPICSHPFIIATNKEVLLLAHNGSVQVDDASAKGIVDTEWAFSEIVKAGGLKRVLPRLKEQTKPTSALNLVLLSIPRDQKAPSVMQCLNYYRASQPGRIEYYKMYTADFTGGKIFFSSTFKDLDISGLSNVELAPLGEVFNLQTPNSRIDRKTRATTVESVRKNRERRT
jgi:hypothetical protein